MPDGTGAGVGWCEYVVVRWQTNLQSRRALPGRATRPIMGYPYLLTALANNQLRPYFNRKVLTLIVIASETSQSPGRGRGWLWANMYFDRGSNQQQCAFALVVLILV